MDFPARPAGTARCLLTGLVPSAACSVSIGDAPEATVRASREGTLLLPSSGSASVALRKKQAP